MSVYPHPAVHTYRRRDQKLTLTRSAFLSQALTAFHSWKAAIERSIATVLRHQLHIIGKRLRVSDAVISNRRCRVLRVDSRLTLTSIYDLASGLACLCVSVGARHLTSPLQSLATYP